MIFIAYPEFNKEECVLRAFLIKLFETALLLRKLVIDLPDVHSLEERVAVRGVGLSNVDKQMFAVLQCGETEETKEDMVNFKSRYKTYNMTLCLLLRDRKKD